MLLCLLTKAVEAQQIIQIGNQGFVPNSTLYAPLFRAAATATETMSAGVLHYTQQELLAAGITPGMRIDSIAFRKVNPAASVGTFQYQMWVGITQRTPPLATNTRWDSVLAGKQQVINNPTFRLTADTGWVVFEFQNSFFYPGGNLEIAHQVSYGSNIPNAINDFVAWRYSAGFGNQVLGVTGNNFSGATQLSGTNSFFKQRPDMRFYCDSAQATDLAIRALNGLSSPLIKGATVPITLNIRNVGFNSIQSFTLNYQVNQGAVQSQNYSLNLASGFGSTVSFSVPLTIPNTDQFSLRCWISSVNNLAADNAQKNDTIGGVYFTALNTGTYNIGTGQYFNNLTEALSQVQRGGIAGSVVLQLLESQTGHFSLSTFPTVAGSQLLLTSPVNNPAILTPNSAEPLFALKNTSRIQMRHLVFARNALFGNNIQWLVQAEKCSLISFSNCHFSGMRGSNATTNRLVQFNNCENTLVDSNTFEHGYGGLHLNVESNEISRLHTISNNNLRELLFTGILANTPFSSTAWHEQLVIRKNSLFNQNQPNQNSDGIHLQQCRRFVIDGNTMRGTIGRHAIFLQNFDGSASNSNDIINNVVAVNLLSSSGNLLRLSLSATTVAQRDYVRILHNSFHLKSNAGVVPESVISVIGATTSNPATNGLLFFNNLAVLSPNGTPTTGTNMWRLSTRSLIDAGLLTASNNRYFHQGGHFAVLSNPSLNVSTFTNWRNLSTNFEQQSSTGEPAVLNLRLDQLQPLGFSPLLNAGLAQTIAPVDHAGRPRDLLPDIGAFEYDSIVNSIAIRSLLQPQGRLIGGSSLVVQLRIYNSGSAPLTQLQFNYRLGTGATHSESWQGSVASGDSLLYTFNQNLLLPTQLSEMPNFTVWTSAPNGQNDYYPTDDTVQTILCIAIPSGTYEIGTQGLFKTPEEFTKYVSCAGILGSVKAVFKFTGDAYLLRESLILNQIVGTSAAHRLEIDGEGDTLHAAPGVALPAFFQILNSSHIEIRRVHFKSNELQNSGIFISASDSVKIAQNTIDLSQFSTAAFHQNCVVLVSESPTSIAHSFAHFLQIDSNVLIGGRAGVRLESHPTQRSRDLHIRQNVIRDFLSNGIQISFVDSGLISRNNIHREGITADQDFIGVFLSSGNEGLRVVENRIHSSHGSLLNPSSSASGIMLSSFANVKRNYIFNNLIYALSTTGMATGIMANNAIGFEIMHNTVALKSSFTSGNVAGIALLGFQQQFRIQNNLIYLEKTGSLRRTALWVDNPSTLQSGMVNQNAYFLAGRLGLRLFVLNGNAPYFSLDSWRAAQSVWDAQSTDANPNFNAQSPWGLRPQSSALHQRGTLISYIPTDFAGQNRGPIPSIGAFEVSPLLRDMALESILDTLEQSCVANLNIPLRVSLFNHGSQQPGLVALRYRLNQNAWANDTVQLAIPSGTRSIHALRQPVPFSNGSDTLQLVVVTANDLNPQNDSFTVYVNNSQAQLITLPYSQDFEGSAVPAEFCVSRGDSGRVLVIGNAITNSPLNGNQSLAILGSESGNSWNQAASNNWAQLNPDYLTQTRLFVRTTGLNRLRLSFKLLHAGDTNNQNFRVLVNNQPVAPLGFANATLPTSSSFSPVPYVLQYQLDGFLPADTLVLNFEAAARWGISNNLFGRLLLDSLRLFESNEIRLSGLTALSNRCEPGNATVQVQIDTFNTPSNVSLWYNAGNGFASLNMSRINQQGIWEGIVPPVASNSVVQYAVVATNAAGTFSTDTLHFVNVRHRLDAGNDLNINNGQSVTLQALPRSLTGSTLRISEILLSKSNPTHIQTTWPNGIPITAFQYIEISNMGLDTVNLHGQELVGFNGSNRYLLQFPPGAKLLPGKVAVIVSGLPGPDTVNNVYDLPGFSLFDASVFGLVLRNQQTRVVHDVFLANGSTFPSDLRVPAGIWSGVFNANNRNGMHRINHVNTNSAAWLGYSASDTSSIGYFDGRYRLYPAPTAIAWFAGSTQVGTGYQITVSPSSTTAYRVSVPFLGCTLSDTVNVSVFNITGPELSFRRIIEPTNNPLRVTGPITLRALVQNQGIANVSSFEVKVRANNSLIAQQTFNQNLAVGDSMAIAMTQSWTPASGAYNLCFEVIAQGDDNPANNILCSNGLQVMNAVAVTNVVNEGWQLYPNPSQSHFKLHFPAGESAYQLEWYDATGRLLGSRNYHTVQGHETTFDVQHLANGVYFMRVYEATGKQIQLRFMVAR